MSNMHQRTPVPDVQVAAKLYQRVVLLKQVDLNVRIGRETGQCSLASATLDRTHQRMGDNIPRPPTIRMEGFFREPSSMITTICAEKRAETTMFGPPRLST